MKSRAAHSFRAPVGIGGYRRSDEGDANRRIDSLDGLGQPLVTFPAHRGGEQDKELIVLADLDGFLGGDVMRRRIQHSRALQKAGRVGQPYRVPVGFNLAGCGPARTRPTVKILKRRWVQEECFQGHRHPFNSTIQADFPADFCGLLQGAGSLGGTGHRKQVKTLKESDLSRC